MTLVWACGTHVLTLVSYYAVCLASGEIMCSAAWHGGCSQSQQCIQHLAALSSLLDYGTVRMSLSLAVADGGGLVWCR